MDLTPHNQLQQWLILALGQMGGSASRAEALARIQATFGLHFTADDLDSPPSRPFETKWRNRVSWQRDRMVKDGLLLPFEGYGTPWRLSDDGRREYEALRHESSLDDPLVNFRPKDSSDYIAHVEGRELIKRRSHEALIADFGAWCASLGFEVDTTVHPRDLVLRRPGEEWLVEAKILYMGNATDAVRAALAQVLMYRFFLYQGVDPDWSLSSASQLVMPMSRFWIRTMWHPCGAQMMIVGRPHRLRWRLNPAAAGPKRSAGVTADPEWRLTTAIRPATHPPAGRFDHCTSYGANRDRTDDLLLAKQGRSCWSQ